MRGSRKKKDKVGNTFNVQIKIFAWQDTGSILIQHRVFIYVCGHQFALTVIIIHSRIRTQPHVPASMM